VFTKKVDLRNSLRPLYEKLNFLTEI